MATAPWLRLTAAVIVCVLALTLAAPARAEAEVLTTLAIVSAGVAVIILVVYLIVANTRGSRMSSAPAPVMVACAEAAGAMRSCWPVASVAEAVALVPGAEVRVVAGPLEEPVLQAQ